MLVTAAQTPLEIRLPLEPLWKLNPGSPTVLTVKRDAKTIARFDAAELADGKALLPPQGEGKLRVQGEVYLCKKQGPSLCLKRKVDVPFVVRSGESARAIEIPLGP